MADPLSIAASVAGLIAAADKIYTTLSNFVTGVQGAPETARHALWVVEDARRVLAGAERLILFHTTTNPQFTPARGSMIAIDHLVAIFTQCVLTFSELEAKVCSRADIPSTYYDPGEADLSMDVLTRARWARRYSDISRLIDRVETHHRAMAMVLNILQCESDIEAAQSSQTLQQQVQQLIDQNHHLVTRIERLELVNDGNPAGSVRFVGDDHQSTAIPDDAQPSILTVDQRSPSSVRRATARVAAPLLRSFSAFEREFEKVLMKSRVYSRVQSRECDVSLAPTSVVGTGAWTAMSGLSLSDISAISVIRLPITPADMARIGHGLTFSAIFAQEMPSVSGHDSDVPERQIPGPRAPKLLHQDAGGEQSMQALHSAQSELESFGVMIIGTAGGNSALGRSICNDGAFTPHTPVTRAEVRSLAGLRVDGSGLFTVDGRKCLLRVMEILIYPGDSTPQAAMFEADDSVIIRAPMFEADGVVIPYLGNSPSGDDTASEIAAFAEAQWIKTVFLLADNNGQASQHLVPSPEAQSLARRLDCQFYQCSASDCDEVSGLAIELIRAMRRAKVQAKEALGGLEILWEVQSTTSLNDILEKRNEMPAVPSRNSTSPTSTD